ARAAITVERSESPWLLATTLAPTGSHGPVPDISLPGTADAVTEPQDAQPSPDRTGLVEMPPLPSLMGVPAPESQKTYSASDVATVRRRPLAAMRPDDGNDATAGTDRTAGVGNEQVVLAPTAVPLPPADPQSAQLATSVPEPQITPSSATPGSNLPNQPLA